MKRLILLAERKANFINRINNLSSRVFKELAKKTEIKFKTSALSILHHLKNLINSGEKSWNVKIFLDDYRNIHIPSFPESGEPIPFVFNFNLNRTERNYNFFDYRGRCLMKIKENNFLISEIIIHIDISLPENFNPENHTYEFVEGLRSVLAHEIAHANDDEKEKELFHKSNGDFANIREIKYLKYYLNPSEIRSHIVEMITILKNRKHDNPNRSFKNRYKISEKAKEIGIKHTDEQKKMTKRVYSMLKNKFDNTSIDEKSKEKLMMIINKDLDRKFPIPLKRFIFDYHISFLKNYSTKMKKRYYDKFFSKTRVHDMDVLKNFYASLIYIGNKLFSLFREVKDIYEHRNDYDRDKNVIAMVQDYNKFYSEFWNNPKISSAFENYNDALLEKTGEKLITDFEEKWDI